MMQLLRNSASRISRDSQGGRKWYTTSWVFSSKNRAQAPTSAMSGWRLEEGHLLGEPLGMADVVGIHHRHEFVGFRQQALRARNSSPRRRRDSCRAG